MQNRETTTFTTPVGGHKVEIKTYLTGREKRALTNVFLASEIKYDEEGKFSGGITGDLMDKAQDLAFTTVIVSINDSKEGIIDTILDGMHVDDYNFIVAEVNKISSPKIAEQKKTS